MATTYAFALSRLPTWLCSNRIATLGRTAQSFPRVSLQSRVCPGAEDGSFMFLVLWEYEVKSGSEKQFEAVYGPAGDWPVSFEPTRSTRRLACSAIPFVLMSISLL